MAGGQEQCFSLDGQFGALIHLWSGVLQIPSSIWSSLPQIVYFSHVFSLLLIGFVVIRLVAPICARSSCVFWSVWIEAFVFRLISCLSQNCMFDLMSMCVRVC